MGRGKKKHRNDPVGTDAPAKAGEGGESSEGRDDGKRKPPWKTIGLIAGGVLVVGALAALTWSTVLSSDEPDVDAAPTAGIATAAAATNEVFDGVVAESIFLGETSAPVTLIEFTSLDCERCSTYRREVVPEILDQWVRPGNLRLELELLVPPDDPAVQLATEASSALAFDNRIWHFTDIYFRDRAADSSGEPTVEYLESIAAQLDLAYEPRFEEVGEDEIVQRSIERAESMATEWTIDRETLPQFLIGPLGGPYERIEADPADKDAFLAELRNHLMRYGAA